MTAALTDEQLIAELRKLPLFGRFDGDASWHISGPHEPLCVTAAARLESLLAERAEMERDAARLDWLEHQYVVVRKPLRYGSAPLFSASAGEEDEPSNIRGLIDVAHAQSSKAI